MTEEVTEQDKPGRELTDAEQEAISGFRTDILDSNLFAITNPLTDTNGQGHWITLYVHGKTICGQVCSAKEWAYVLKTKAHQNSGTESGILKDWVDDYSELQAVYKAAWSRSDDPDPSEEDIRLRWYRFKSIFLVNGFEMTATGIGIPLDGTPVKIYRDSVDGWALGQLATK